VEGDEKTVSGLYPLQKERRGVVHLGKPYRETTTTNEREKKGRRKPKKREKASPVLRYVLGEKGRRAG